MNTKHVDYFEIAYPEFYSEKNYGGFAVGDGWFAIIDELSGKIQSHQKWKPETPPVVIEQIKEKFGSLRFYYQGGDEKIAGLVSMAEAMSRVTCEVCGNAGKARGGGWIRVLCDTHEAEIKQRKKEVI